MAIKNLTAYKKVLKLVTKIPRGKIITYKLLAVAAGTSKNYRQVGEILKENKQLNKFPCYKVVKSSGKMGGYNCGKLAKKKLLQKDGIKIYNNRIKNFKDYIFKF